MYAAEFDYHRASSLAEAQRLLAAHPGAKLLAGGHSLIPLLKLRLAMPEAVIDIGRIPELRGISTRGNAVRIGALTTHAELASSPELRKAAPALSEAAAVVGDPAVRNRGTIGGNVAHADPASDLPIVLVALDARMIAVGPGGERRIAATDFFTGLMSTSLGEAEILAAIELTPEGRGQGSAYVKFAHPASRYAVIGAAAALRLENGACAAVRVAVGGLVPRATRAHAVERVLTGKPPGAEEIGAAAAHVAADLGSDVSGDLFASAEYRAAMAPVYVGRALSAAAARAGLS